MCVCVYLNRTRMEGCSETHAIYTVVVVVVVVVVENMTINDMRQTEPDLDDFVDN